MEMKTLTLIKKNRVYFAAKTQSGHSCKLKITPESETLELGEHTLVCEDLSVRSKYGTDLIYAVKADIKETGIVTLRHNRFNNWLINDCHKLGGKWDAVEKVWIFSAIVADKVEELDFEYNADVVQVEITAKKSLSCWRDSVDFFGYPVAKAQGRNSGAKLGEGFALIDGDIDSGGSWKNWTSEISSGSIFRTTISRYLAERASDYWEIKILNTLQ